MSLRYEGPVLVYDGAAFLSASSDFRAMIPSLGEGLGMPALVVPVLVSLPDMVDSAVGECERLRAEVVRLEARCAFLEDELNPVQVR